MHTITVRLRSVVSYRAIEWDNESTTEKLDYLLRELDSKPYILVKIDTQKEPSVPSCSSAVYYLIIKTSNSTYSIHLFDSLGNKCIGKKIHDIGRESLSEYITQIEEKGELCC